MATPQLPDDFKEFLKLLNAHEVRYLLVGGYAVSYHGYPRTTADIDLWIAVSRENAEKLVDVFRAFGMDPTAVTPDHFLQPDRIIRMGVPPLRLEILTGVDGVQFDPCFEARVVDEIDGVTVPIISLADLRKNKQAAHRHKDLDDLENLPNE